MPQPRQEPSAWRHGPEPDEHPVQGVHMAVPAGHVTPSGIALKHTPKGEMHGPEPPAGQPQDASADADITWAPAKRATRASESASLLLAMVFPVWGVQLVN